MTPEIRTQLEQLIAEWRGPEAEDAMARGYAEAAFATQVCANQLEALLATLQPSPVSRKDEDRWALDDPYPMSIVRSLTEECEGCGECRQCEAAKLLHAAIDRIDMLTPPSPVSDKDDIAKRLCQLVYDSSDNALRRGVCDIARELNPYIAASKKLDAIYRRFGWPSPVSDQKETA